MAVTMYLIATALKGSERHVVRRCPPMTSVGQLILMLVC